MDQMAKFQWKTIDEIEQEKQVASIQREADEQLEEQRLLLDEFLMLQAEEYILNEDIPEEQKTKWMGIFEPFRVGENYPVGKKIRFKGVVYEVIMAHTSQADWTPDHLPAMFRVFLQPETDDGTDVIHEWVQPLGSHDAYSSGDQVSFHGKIYESTVNNNVWSPVDYGWKVLDG